MSLMPVKSHFFKKTFTAQIIVTKELSPEENLYLRCRTNKLQDIKLANQLADDYKNHQEQDIYIRYMHQLTTANTILKGESPMICEELLNLFGTSSEEIIEGTKKEADEYYLPKIDKLSSQNIYLKPLLTQNNIPLGI